MSTNNDSEQRAKEHRLQLEASYIYGSVTFRAANGRTKYTKDFFPDHMSLSDVETIAAYLGKYLPQAHTPLTYTINVRQVVPFWGLGKEYFQIKCKFAILSN